MIISQIIAFSLHFHTYNIVTRSTSIKELENRLQYISLSEKYSQECYKEWSTERLPKNCILLIETGTKFIHKSPQKVRTFIRNYCKKPLNLSPLTSPSYQSPMDQHMTYLDVTDKTFQKYIKRYPECENQLKELLLDEQYKREKDQLYKKIDIFTSGSRANEVNRQTGRQAIRQTVTGNICQLAGFLIA